MEDQIKNMLADLVENISDYSVEFLPRDQLNPERQILNVEIHGIMSTTTALERIFTCRNRLLSELPIKKRRVLRKDYGDYEPLDEMGEPVGRHLDGSEDLVIIVHNSFHTQPKGPHEFRRVIEVYQKDRCI